eukprot:TRINITY_DN65027_c0_g1_i1.p1 TRINITY_DN65027_c0_g1~~TRINITY_DN65027_c0_g1_i1.p1  ORF type:complete len:421 (+),score=125.60 TRINITY_DN65027_c0_g1_i1:72-1265(+)
MAAGAARQRRTALAILGVTLLCPSARACTSVAAGGKYGGVGDVVFGRTMELALGAPFTEWVIAAHFKGEKMGRGPYQLPGKMMCNSSLEWVNTHAFASVESGALSEEEGFIPEGLNEAGLSVSALTLRMSKYATRPADGLPGLCHAAVAPYLLGTAGSLAEARKALEHVSVFFNAQDTAGVDVMKLHWVIAEAGGAAAVVEFIDGAMVWSDDKTGILTNDPSYQWHLSNLDNFVALSSNLPKHSHGSAGKGADGRQIPSASSEGTNLLGLPGDLSPASRFVRMFYLRRFATTAAPTEALQTPEVIVQGLLNTVFIVDGTVGKHWAAAYREKTHWATMKKPAKRLLYVRGYNSMNWRVVDVSKLTGAGAAASGKARQLPIWGTDLGATDVTTQLAPVQ